MITNLQEIKNLDKKHILLKNVNNDTLGVLHGRDIKLNLRYNNVSELSFVVDKDNCPCWNQITSFRRILIEDIGLFIVNKPQIINDGITEYKIVTAMSYETDINRKTIPLLQGTYKFYSPLETEENLVQIIMSYLPNWSIEKIDSSLWNVYRTFDLPNKSLLDFMYNECSTSFECVFEFDTINQKIKITAYENIPKKTDVYFSLNNLILELNLTEKTDEIFTALTIFGANDLSINLVNPLGSTIYNFNHFINSEGFMSDELRNSVISWQNLINAQQIIYSNHLTNRRIKLSELITLQTQLTELESQLKALEVTRDALLESGLSAVNKNTEVKNKRVEITNKKSTINNKQIEIDNIDSSLQVIQNTLKITSYFTQSQFLQLEQFIIQTSITDDSFLITDLDTELDKQNTAQDLYNKYKNYLDINDELKFEFSTNLVDFISLEEYKKFTNQLSFGSQVTIEVNDKKDLAYPMLLGLDIDWNDSIDIKYLFSTSVRLKDSIMNYDDFSNEVSNMSSKIAGSSIKWGEFTKTYRDDVDNLFKKGMRTDLTRIINSSQEELIINEQGLLARRYISDGLYEDEQLKLIHNNLAFTRNGWDSLSTIVGRVTLPDGSQAYGLNDEKISVSKLKTKEVI